MKYKRKYKFKKGERVKYTSFSFMIENGATGIIDENRSHSPFVIWDKPQGMGRVRIPEEENKLKAIK